MTEQEVLEKIKTFATNWVHPELLIFHNEHYDFDFFIKPDYVSINGNCADDNSNVIFKELENEELIQYVKDTMAQTIEKRITNNQPVLGVNF